jgi:hypothetical protein
LGAALACALSRDGEAVAQAARHASVAAALQDIKPVPDPRRAGLRAPGRTAPGQAYEAHIFQTRSVPTRDNLHDFFNGLVWLAFPQAKRRLNALQAAEIERMVSGPCAVRCAMR